MSAFIKLSTRAGALGVVLAIPLGLLAITVVPHVYAGKLRERIEEQHTQIGSLTAIAIRSAQATGDRPAGSSTAPDTAAQILASTAGIAAARLQNDLAALVRARGGEVRLMQVVPQQEPQQSAAGRQRVSVRLNADVDNTGLRDLLLEIETRMPMLFVDELVVRRREGAGAVTEAGDGQAHRLAVEIRVSAYHTAEKVRE